MYVYIYIYISCKEKKLIFGSEEKFREISSDILLKFLTVKRFFRCTKNLSKMSCWAIYSNSVYSKIATIIIVSK